MSAPELLLDRPVEIDGNRHDRLAIASYEAIARFNTANPERVILSMSRVFGVPRRVIRHLDPADAERAGDLIRNILDDYTRSVR